MTRKMSWRKVPRAVLLTLFTAGSCAGDGISVLRQHAKTFENTSQFETIILDLVVDCGEFTPNKMRKNPTGFRRIRLIGAMRNSRETQEGSLFEYKLCKSG